MTFEQKIFIEMFYYMRNQCESVIKQIEEDKISFNNPKWGLEAELPDKKYQLVLTLTEVEKWMI